MYTYDSALMTKYTCMVLRDDGCYLRLVAVVGSSAEVIVAPQPTYTASKHLQQTHGQNEGEEENYGKLHCCSLQSAKLIKLSV